MEGQVQNYNRHHMKNPGFEHWMQASYKLDFRESDVSLGKTEVKQVKFLEFMSPTRCEGLFYRNVYSTKYIPFRQALSSNWYNVP